VIRKLWPPPDTGCSLEIAVAGWLVSGSGVWSLGDGNRPFTTDYIPLTLNSPTITDIKSLKMYYRQNTSTRYNQPSGSFLMLHQVCKTFVSGCNIFMTCDNTHLHLMRGRIKVTGTSAFHSLSLWSLLRVQHYNILINGYFFLFSNDTRRLVQQWYHFYFYC